MHDGAVILQKDRIAAAACFLPPDHESDAGAAVRHAPPRGHRDHGRDRLPVAGGLRRDRADFVAAFGELASGLSPAEVVERINRHFGVERPSAQIEDFAADIPLHTETPRKPPRNGAP